MNVDALDAARDYMRAFNRGDRAALVEAYEDDAVFEPVAPLWLDETRIDGREAIAGAIDWFLATYEGAFGGGLFFEVRTIARIETGWTHVEWAARVRHRSTGEPAAFAGYFHFLIHNGRIRRQRGVAHLVASGAGADGVADEDVETAVQAPVPPGTTPRGSRTYPSRPIVGVGAVIVFDDGRVVLIKRKFEPLKGQWSLPGGSLEVGETLEAGVAREMLEETGLEVEVGPVIDVFDRILLDADQKVRYHFVLIDYLCVPRGGTLAAASDVADAVLADPADLSAYKLTPKAEEVIRKALAQWRLGVPSP